MQRRATALGALLGGVAFVVSQPGALAAQDTWRTDFTQHTVPLEEIVSGGPPKDGIPAIDAPRFVSVREADAWLSDTEPVILVRQGSEARAYPYQILIWHEIVNDLLGGTPLVVTYCPLCNTALVFERRFEGRLLDFGATGRLRHSDLVMYDRQTESWWQQATGEGIVGAYAGRTLSTFPAQTTSWGQFKVAYPEGRVLSRETGYDRPYGRNPYEGYDRGTGPFARFFSRDADDRLPAMERVAAVRVGERFVAYPFSTLEERRVMNDRVGSTPVAVLWVAGVSSALDAVAISDGRDVGSAGAFVREAEGRTLTFSVNPVVGFVDRETDSRWDVTGRAISGPLAGTQLRSVLQGEYFWFAWAAFRPGTEVRR